MICKVCFFGLKNRHFMQIESVLQTKNLSEPAKNWFSVALLSIVLRVGFNIRVLGVSFLTYRKKQHPQDVTGCNKS